MKILYLDCGMGAAGDMLTAALLELLPDPDAFVAELNALGIPGVEFIRELSTKCGITGTHMAVKVDGIEEDASPEHHHDHEHSHDHDHEHGHSHDLAGGHSHHHSGMHNITQIVAGLHLPESVRQDVLAVYDLIAQAESRAHGVPVKEIHFHEVGTMDAVADITAVCLLMHRIQPEQVVVSPIHVGSGHVHCAHGILPVPAPATADILRGVPIYGGGVKGELCTPTGAALLKHFATDFGPMPVMRTSAIGYGMGKKDFTAANCIRALLGDTEGQTDLVCELSCNVDDMTAEAMGFAADRFFEAGALEVYTVPVGMKKSRPGTLICVICREQDRETLAAAMLRHTTTIGVRESLCRRYVLDRNIQTLETPYGPVRRKDSRGYGVVRSKYEFEDLARIAKAQNLSLAETQSLIEGR